MEEKQTTEQTVENKEVKNLTPHKDSIDFMGFLAVAAGVVAGLICGNAYPTATLKHTYSSSIDYDYSFNWGLGITVAVCGLMFAALLFALGHIAGAIEEKK